MMVDCQNGVLDLALSLSNTRAEAYKAIQQYLYDNFEVVPLTERNVAMAFHDTIATCLVSDVYTPNLRFIGK